MILRVARRSCHLLFVKSLILLSVSFGCALTSDPGDPAHRVLGQEVLKQAGRYEAFACLGADAIRSPPVYSVTSNSPDFLPWVRDTAGQLGVPIEFVDLCTT